MSTKNTVIALGFFDGVHLGHAALLQRTKQEAVRRGVTPAIFTFAQPPKEVITGVPCPLITSPEDRADLVRRLYGIEEIIMAPFDQKMMTTSWESFITEILVGQYHAVHLVAGHDHRFGHKNLGSPELLIKKCAELGLGCDIVPKVKIGDTTVSSTHIRQLLEAGQVEEAARFLGHPHVLTQTVRHGRHIGRTIGVPTVNLVTPPRVLELRHGVYATRVFLPDGSCYGGVTNVGTRPTVNNGTDVTVESWILDYDGDLYGQTIRLEFLRHIRDEIRFSSLADLKAQIARDAEVTRQCVAALG